MSFFLFLPGLRRLPLPLPLRLPHTAMSESTALFSTKVLTCDPSTISFPPSSDNPQFSKESTLRALKVAASHLIDDAQTVVFPTETVYGLGALALHPSASAKIFSTKGRPPDNPLIVHVSSLSMLRSLLPTTYVIPKSYSLLISHFWPGPLTLLFPRNPDIVPALITANQPTVAIRMPSHPVARALIAVAHSPLAAPSANTSGKPSPTKAEHVFQDLNGKVPLILDGGPCNVGLESTVVDGLHNDGHIRILRPGGITVEDIESVFRLHAHDFPNIPKVLVHKRDYTDEKIEAVPTTPGMKYRHYSPSVPVILLLTRPSLSQLDPPTSFSDYIHSFRKSSGYGRSIMGVLAPTDSNLWPAVDAIKDILWLRYPLGPLTEPNVIAHNLFDGLLSLEKDGVELIFIEEIDEAREGLAIMNRVRKASSKNIRIQL